MNKSAVRKTAVCSVESNVYVVESPLLGMCAGIDEQRSRAWEIFDDFVDELYVMYLEGHVVGKYNKRGRPPKNGVALNCSVRPETKELLERLSKQIGCSQGEVVDFLLAFYQAAISHPGTTPISTVCEPPHTPATARAKKPTRRTRRA